MTNESGFAVVAMSKSNSIKQRFKKAVEQHGSSSDDNEVEQKSDWRDDAKGRDFAGSHTIDLSHLDDETDTTESTDNTVDAANLRAALTSAQRRQESIPRTGNVLVDDVGQKAASTEQAPTPGAVPDSEGDGDTDASPDREQALTEIGQLLADAYERLDALMADADTPEQKMNILRDYEGKMVDVGVVQEEDTKDWDAVKRKMEELQQ